MTRAEAEAEIRQITRTCRGPIAAVDGRARIAALLAESKREEASALDESLRQGCGADFNDIVAKGPLDGAVHAYQCPRCGVEGMYRAPAYAIDSGPAA